MIDPRSGGRPEHDSEERPDQDRLDREFGDFRVVRDVGLEGRPPASAALGLLAAASGCMDRPVAPQQPSTVRFSTQQYRATSIDKIDLHAFLASHQKLFSRFGGHRQAIGLTVRTADLPLLRQRLEDAASAWPSELFEHRYEYELMARPGQLADGFAALLRRLRPHGMGNPEPLIRMGPLAASARRPFGGAHLELRAAAAGEGSLSASVAAAERLVLFQANRFSVDWEAPFEILAHAEDDSWNGGFRLRVVEARSWGDLRPP